MGKQYLNGVVYGSQVPYKQLTKAEYDALPDSKNSDGIIYCITDQSTIPGNVISLSDLSDTTITTPLGNQILIYDSINSKWVNSDNLNATVGNDKVPFRFTYDTTTQKYGYLDGADTFHPFNEGGGGNGLNLLTPISFDLTTGYVSNGNWYYGTQSPLCYSDVYEVSANKMYYITLGATVSSRFRIMFSTTNVTIATSDVSGYNIYYNDSPSAYNSISYKTSNNGYIVIGKSNNGTSNIVTYVFEDTNSLII